MFALGVASGHHRLVPHPGRASGEGTAEIVLTEEDLRLSTAYDGLEGGRPLDPSFGPTQEIERAKDDVVGANRDGRGIREDSCDFVSRTLAERARFTALARARVVDEQDAPPRDRNPLSPRISAPVSGASSPSPLQ